MKKNKQNLKALTVRFQPLQLQRLSEYAEDWGWSKARTCRELIDRGLDSLDNQWEIAIHVLEDLYNQLEDRKKRETVSDAQEILFQQKVSRHE